MRPWQTFRRKLQLLTSALLCLVVTAVTWAAYRQVKQVLVESASSRLEGTAREVANLLADFSRRIGREVRLSAGDTVVVAALADPSPRNRAAAEAALRRARGRLTALHVGLYAADGTPVLLEGPPLLTRVAGKRDTSDVGPLVATDSGPLYRIEAPVVASTGDTLGHLVVHRRIASSPGARQVIDLIGEETTLRVGNLDGRLWSDIASLAAPPPGPPRIGEAAEYRGEDGMRVYATALPIRGTPWVVALWRPRDVVLAPARGFLLNIAWVTLVFVGIGFLLAWVLSAQTTAPLADITRAAEDVARGDYDRRVMVTGSHEMSSLAASFNSMAEQVGTAARDLGRHASELEAANAGLRESEERYRRLLEVAHEGICTVDAVGVVTYANPRLAEMLGYAVEELRGRSLFDFMEPAVAFESRNRFARRMRGIPETRELTLRRKDGSALQTNKSVSPLFDAQGEFTGALYMLTDLTDRQALQAQLVQSQKMEAVGQLAGGVAHDFNNLLTVVTSYSGMLLTELPEGSAARADVQEIADAADRAAALTRQLLAFSRQQVLQPRVVDLNEVVDNIRRMLGRVVREDVRLETKLAPALGRVHADPGQLEQVIVNLAVNARDAMPEGGTLTIETRDVELDEAYAELHPDATAGPYVLLAVSDTGIGMTPATRARIFEPFFTTKAAGQGTGLGLSTVYGIVRQSGGHVSVYSEPGRGSTFRVYLPRAEAAVQRADRRPAEVSMAHGTETVLLVEDEASVRSVARRILERAGYTVVEASSGAEALRLFEERAGEVDVLLTDMVMPEMGGRELASRLRERSPALRAVFMSGYTEDTVLRQGAVDPGAAFLQKPFTTRELTEKVREVLEVGASSG